MRRASWQAVCRECWGNKLMVLARRTVPGGDFKKFEGPCPPCAGTGRDMIPWRELFSAGWNEREEMTKR